MLRRSDAGRAIFVSSGAAAATGAPTGAPTPSPRRGSKRWCKIYADEMANTPVRANLINPGPTRTAMRAKAFPGEDPASLASRPEDVTETFVELAEASTCTDNGQALRPEDRERGAVVIAPASS